MGAIASQIISLTIVYSIGYYNMVGVAVAIVISTMH